jgi:LuxR family maltose regulon positive regulatory protein
LLYELNDLANSELNVQGSLELGQLFASLELPVASYMQLAFIRQAQGQPEEAFQLAEQVIGLQKKVGVPTFYAGLLRGRAGLLYLRQGRLATVRQLIEEDGLSTAEQPGYQRETGQILLGRLLLAEGRAGEAAGWFLKLEEATSTSKRWGTVLQIRILRALALAASGDMVLALELLETCLEQAAGEGYMRVFLDEGAPMQALLDRLAGREDLTPAIMAYLARLRRTFEQPWQHSALPLEISPTLAIPLSKRELQILAMLATNQPVAAIAQKLVVAPGTLKKHLHNIYQKLGVKKRDQALDRAQELGLLPA